MKLENGQTHEGDLLIGADGIRSQVLYQIHMNYTFGICFIIQ